MYPLLDEALYLSLAESEQPALSKFNIYYLGKKKLTAENQYIELYHENDKPNLETFDSSERVLSHVVLVTIKKMDYLKAQILLKDIVRDIKHEISTNQRLRDLDALIGLTIGDITPYYERGILNQAGIQVLSVVDEDYSQEEETFDTITTNGDLL